MTYVKMSPASDMLVWDGWRFGRGVGRRQRQGAPFKYHLPERQASHWVTRVGGVDWLEPRSARFTQGILIGLRAGVARWLEKSGRHGPSIGINQELDDAIAEHFGVCPGRQTRRVQ